MGASIPEQSVPIEIPKWLVFINNYKEKTNCQQTNVNNN
jgi:hypothetical protein